MAGGGGLHLGRGGEVADDADFGHGGAGDGGGERAGAVAEEGAGGTEGEHLDCCCGFAECSVYGW